MNDSRFTEINDAVLSGSPSRISLLKLSQSELNGRFLDPSVGGTLIYYSSIMKKLAVVEYLIDIGGEINVKDGNGNPLLHFFVGRASCEKQLDRKRALHQLIAKMLDAGADYNAKSDDGHTALTLAMLYRNHELVDLLEAHGARGRFL